MTGRLRHYVCGSTAHDLGAMFRGSEKEIRQFPAGVFLYDGSDGRRVLFDTGYSTGHWQAGWRGAVYRRLLPPRVEDGDDVAAQLAGDGVAPSSVTHVVLSHLHPDHVGGVGRFPGATFVRTAGQRRTLAGPSIRSGVITGLLPSWFSTARTIDLDDASFDPVRIAGQTLRAHDLLGDGTYLVLDLPGHADGHVGALVEGRVLLAGDAAWGSDLIERTDRLRRLPRAVQHDPEGYTATAGILRDLAGSGIRIVCSHDPFDGRDLL